MERRLREGDIDLDGKPDLVFTSNTQSFAKKKTVGGMHWLSGKSMLKESLPIADAKGKKYDRIELPGSGRRWRPGCIDV